MQQEQPAALPAPAAAAADGDAAAPEAATPAGAGGANPAEAPDRASVAGESGGELHPAGQVVSIPAHSFLLACRSRYFDRLFRSRARPHREIEVSDLSPAALKVCLRFMYTDAISGLEEDTIWDTLRAAARFHLPVLGLECEEFVTGNLVIDNACVFLAEALRIGHQRLLARCRTFVTHHANSIFLADNFFHVPRVELAALVRRDDLAVVEIDLFKGVLEWARVRAHHLRSRCGAKTPERRLMFEALRDILPHVRFPLMSEFELLGVVRQSRMLHDFDLLQLVAHAVSPVEFAISTPDLPYCARSRHRVFGYEEPGDDNGLFFHLGTLHGGDYNNPSLLGLCTVWCSGLKGNSHDISVLLSREIPIGFKGIVAPPHVQPYFAVDLGRRARLRPTHFTLTHGSDEEKNMLRSFAFDGTNEVTAETLDDESVAWTQLATWQDDERLDEAFATRAFELPRLPESAKFRAFRVRMVDVNSSRKLSLLVSGFELYGQLEIVQPRRKRVARPEDAGEENWGRQQQQQQQPVGGGNAQPGNAGNGGEGGGGDGARAQQRGGAGGPAA